MRLLTLIIVVVALSGCAHFKDTIIGGANGKLEYCVTLLSVNACINGERSGAEESTASVENP